MYYCPACGNYVESVEHQCLSGWRNGQVVGPTADEVSPAIAELYADLGGTPEADEFRTRDEEDLGHA